MRILAFLGMLLTAALVGVVVFVYSGAYNIGADDPHWSMTSQFLESFRNRSLQRRARQVSVPNLEDRQLILKGAGQYAAMCAGCHLAPGVKPNELSRGLYPPPPELAKRRLDPRVSYLAIKHGLKMTGMPAWGGRHGDQQVWALVAFVQKLPDLTPEQYREHVNSPTANAAGAMASHGTMMPQAPRMPAQQGPRSHDEPSR